MTRRSSVNYLNRLYSTLPYLLPMVAVVSDRRPTGFWFAQFLVEQFNLLVYLLIPFKYVDGILSISIIDFISIRFVAWFCVFIFVVRSYKVNHFVRFNAMQALLLDIVVALVRAMTQLLDMILGQVSFFPFMLKIIASVTFLGITTAVGYTVFNCVLGKYPDKIPMISEITYQQVR